jgi:FkbM family methyltransferase
MFYPRTYLGKIFRHYLLMPTHWGKVRVQDYIGKILFPKGIDIRNHAGLKFKLSPNDWMTRIILLHSAYEKESLLLAKRILKDGGIFVDIGANFGLYSCLLTHSSPKIQTIAVEPNYMVVSKLINNIQINNLGQKVKVINTAISKSEQLLRLEINNMGNLGTARYEADGAGYLNVAGYPLKNILKSNNLSTIDLVKIDIEGKEMDILEEFPFQDFYIKNLILEFNCLSNVDLDSFRKFFDSKGFDLYNVLGVQVKNQNDIIEDNLWVRNRKNI